MSEIENDSISIESGSCDCSDYNTDMSWFYFSKDLKESSIIQFSIINNNNKKKSEEEKNIITKEIPQEKKNEEKNKFQIKVNLNKGPQKIQMPKNMKKENDIQNDNSHLNIARKFTNYRSKYRMALNNNKNQELNYKEDINKKDEGYNSDTNDNKNKEEQDEINSRMKNRHLTHKVNISKKINTFNTNITENENKEKKFNLFSNRFHTIKEREKEKEKENENIQGNKEKDKIQINPVNEGFRKKFFNSYKNYTRFRGKYEEEKEKQKEKQKEKENTIKESINEEKNNEPLKNQIRLKTLKEKVVNETKNLPLQPGQTIKPKIVTTRKLQPVTKMVTNDDGTQNIITENTTLITTIINELVDSSNKENDNYPLDIQLVKQHITKKYVTEIESNPYLPKKRFSHFNY